MVGKEEMLKRGFKANIRRWEAFWHHDVADRPPVVIHLQEEGQAQLPLVDFDSVLDPDYIAERVDRAERMFAQRADFPDDTFPMVSAPTALAVAGLAYGAKARAESGTYWFEPVLERIEDWRGIDIAARQRGVDRILDITRYLVERSRGRYAVGVSALGGSADIVGYLLGRQKLATALYDTPGEVQAFIQSVANLRKDLLKEILDMVPRYGGGTLTAQNYWVRGKGGRFRDDFATLISPKQYREMLLKYDVQLARGMDCSWYHVHSGGIHMAQEVADTGAFCGIQICNDYPAGPTIDEILPTLQYIQQRACLILHRFTVDQLDRIIGELSPNGLAIDLQCYDSTTTADIQEALMSRPDGEQAIKWLEDRSRRAIRI